MKTKGMKITERDIEILTFINQFGFCEMPHLDKRFSWKKPRNYQIMDRLVKTKLVKHERVFHGRHGIFRVTEKGAKLTELPSLTKIPLATYHHDLILIDVYLCLCKLYPSATWISERILLRDKYIDGVGKFGHSPDGILVMEDGKKIAIEVELTLKGKARLEKILRAYSASFTYEEVWYYCKESIMASMRASVDKWPFIKIYALGDLFNDRKS